MATPSVSARRLAALLWPRRWLLAAFVAVAALASAVYALTREEQFESNAVLAQSKDEGEQLGGGISGLLGQVTGMTGGLPSTPWTGRPIPTAASRPRGY